MGINVILLHKVEKFMCQYFLKQMNSLFSDLSLGTVLCYFYITPLSLVTNTCLLDTRGITSNFRQCI